MTWLLSKRSMALQKPDQKRVGKVKLFTWPGPVTLSVLYQVRCQLLPLTFVICWKHLVSVSTLRRRQRVRLKVGGRERSRGRVWFTQQKLLPIWVEFIFSLSYFLEGLMSYFRLHHKLLPPKKHFSYPCLQRNHTSALLWNESSYQPCLTGKLSSPSTHEQQSSPWSLPL